MSIVEEHGTALDPRLVRWGGYGLAAGGVAAGVAAIIAPSATTTTLALALALASAAAAWWAPELFEVTSRRSRGLNPVFLAPAGFVFFTGIAQDFVAVSPLLIAAGLGAAIAGGAAAMRRGRAGVASPVQFVVLLTLIGAGLGSGGAGLADVRFDASPPQAFRATVASMYVTRGKSTGYHLRLGPWGPKPQGDSVTVSWSLYDQLKPGDQVCIGLHPGAFAIPWYALRACPGPS